MSVTVRKLYIGDKSISKKNRPYKFQLGIYQFGNRRRETIKHLIIYPDEPIESKKEKLRLVESIRSSYQIDLNTKQYGFASSLLKKQDFIAYYKKTIESKTGSTYIGYINTLKQVVHFEADSFSFELIDKHWIEELTVFLSSRVSLQSAKTYRQHINHVLKQAVKDQIIHSNPCDLVEPIRYHRKDIAFLLEDEIRILINTPWVNEHLRLSFLFGCFTGLRQSDLRNLKWSNIKEDKIHFTQQKTKKTMAIPLSENAKLFIPKKRKGVDLVFNMSTHSHCLNRSFKKWLRRTSINKPLTFHSSRHTFATLLITAGVNIYTVSKLLGHSDIKTTMVYAKVIDTEKEKAISSLPSF